MNVREVMDKMGIQWSDGPTDPTAILVTQLAGNLGSPIPPPAPGQPSNEFGFGFSDVVEDVDYETKMKLVTNNQRDVIRWAITPVCGVFAFITKKGEVIMVRVDREFYTFGEKITAIRIIKQLESFNGMYNALQGKVDVGSSPNGEWDIFELSKKLEE